MFDYQGSCPEAGTGVIVSLKTVLNLQSIGYQVFCPEAGMEIIVPLQTVLSLHIITRVLALRLAWGLLCSLNSAQPANCRLSGFLP